MFVCLQNVFNFGFTQFIYFSFRSREFLSKTDTVCGKINSIANWRCVEDDTKAAFHLHNMERLIALIFARETKKKKSWMKKEIFQIGGLV